ncbi:hypothetical protein P3T76_001829 [Phytophthora citrophthora]|uniref:Uncharacterized protein n=1 Tax=Phytophthora citrophthora TaxID=4793 RepID=A0AAD9GY83_9STRA|nr:hypothetical protein P3T76_001829 [Phytophthora citrophthora]
MSATAHELENDIAQMEDRLANVKVAVDVEREAWRRSSHTGKRGTKWKGATAPRTKKKDTSTPSSSANNDDVDEGVTMMPGYWDALELAQYLNTKHLGSYAQVIVYEQITGKMLLDTPAPKLRKLFENVETSNSWKNFQDEYVKLKKHQRLLEKVVATNQPDSARSVDSALETPVPSSSAGAALVFPLISPRVPVTQQPKVAKPPTASKPSFPLRKPASSNNIPLATCWNCKTRFFRPHVKRPVGTSTDSSSQPVSSSMRASLVARAYCSTACRESIESGDIRISPSISAQVKDTSTIQSEEKTKRNRIATGLTSMVSSVSDQPGPELLCRSESITGKGLGGGNDYKSPVAKTKRLRKAKTFVRRPSRPDKDPNTFNFLHVAAPKREVDPFLPISPRPTYAEVNQAPVQASNVYRAAMACGSPNGRLEPPALILTNSGSQRMPKQSKTYQQSRYKLDPELFQTHQETFSSCFGAVPMINRSHALTAGGVRVVDYGHGNFLRLNEFLTVRALHRLSMTARCWYDLITTPSAFSDALWGAHVLRIWRPTEEDEELLHSIGVLKKPERPRRMLHILTRQVSRVTVENMKILLNSESWQLATVVTLKEGESIRSLYKSTGKKRERLPAELYEQVTVIYTRAGEIVAVCARQLIRPVDPMALLTDILQGLKSGELSRVHCRRLRLFSQTNRLPFDQWTLLPHCSRVVVEFFWSEMDMDSIVPVLPVWHQKLLNKLQHGLQQRLLGKDSVSYVIKTAHDQNASHAVLLSLEKFLTRCHTQGSCHS